MAGEWIAVDLGLPEKPEVQELEDITGERVEVIVYRLYRLWGWASMHSADGTARTTPSRLARTIGGDEAWFRALASVGWLEIDDEAGTVTIPGWDRRFSQAAKARIQEKDRKAAYEERNPGRRESRRSPDAPPSARADAPPSDAPTAESRRGEERRREVPPPPPREASPESPEQSWAALRAAWNAEGAPGKPWRPSRPPDGLADRLRDPEWLDEALEAIPRLRTATYFRTPVTLIQFVGEGFVRRLLGGGYDDRGSTDPPRPVRDQAAEERRDAERRAEWAKQREESAFEQSRKRRSAGAAAAIGLGGNLVKRVADDDDDTETLRARALKALQEARR